MQVKDLDAHLKKILNIDAFKDIDDGYNGLQIGLMEQEIKKIALAVDVSIETIALAQARGADMLLTHHGILWGHSYPITGNQYKRLEAFIKSGMSLYSIHFPLDASYEYGNNHVLARSLGLKNLQDFGFYKGKALGVQGILEVPQNREAFIEQHFSRHILSNLPFGKETIVKVGIITGGAPKEYKDAVDADLDLYITGDALHQVYHDVKENNLNMISIGHYYSEIWGVKALGKHLEEYFGIETFFVDVPTNL